MWPGLKQGLLAPEVQVAFLPPGSSGLKAIKGIPCHPHHHHPHTHTCPVEDSKFYFQILAPPLSLGQCSPASLGQDRLGSQTVFEQVMWRLWP